MWTRIKRFFRDSETIFWARLQMLIGALAYAATYVDVAIVTDAVPADWVPLVILANGVATEYLRRRRSDDL